MIVVKIVVNKKFVISGWKISLDNIKKIVFLLLIGIWFLSMYVVLNKFVNMVLIVESVIYDIFIWCIVGIFLIEWIDMKWIIICGWLK